MNVIDFMIRNRGQVLTLTAEHLWFVAVSVGLAIAIGVPLGILITRHPRWKRPILGANNVIQVVPSLALFGLLLPVPWLGARAERLTVLALVLYALLPIVQNTYAGITGINAATRDAARGMGMSDWQLLWIVDLPLSAPVILAGIRVATVITVGVATIAAAIGAGGLGEFIFRGLAMVDNRVILAGAIPAAVLALVLDQGIGAIERLLRVPD
jgi:osmoprotectant transport system permease protein